MLFIRIYKSTGQRRRVLLIGAGKAGQALAELYRSSGAQSFNLIGYIDDDEQKVGKTICDLRVLGSSEHLLRLIDAYHISDIVIAINGEIQGAMFQTILDAQENGIEVTRMPILYEEMTGRVPIHHLESDWIIRSFVDGLHVSGFYELMKRLLDILGGTGADF
jgi:FlaA1/EpsC-like NDP-sugar epimerase